MDGGRRFPEQIDGPRRAAGTRLPFRIFRRRRRVTALQSEGLVSQLTRPGVGWAGVAVLLATTGVYGATVGERWGEVGELAQSAPEAFARGSGFTIARIEVEGRKVVTNNEILAALGYEPGQSLMSLDVAAARETLLANPLIKQATIRKLYPDRLSVQISERVPFALWQVGEKLSVIAADGTVIEAAGDSRFVNLPLVVGAGADISASRILKALEPHAELRDKVYAAVRVGSRRWNLRLKNGMDVKLPEEALDAALAQVAELDRSQKITDRDITELDLRRDGLVTVRLSDDAAAAMAAASKDKNKRAGT